MQIDCDWLTETKLGIVERIATKKEGKNFNKK